MNKLAKISIIMTIAVVTFFVSAAVMLCVVFPNKYASEVNDAADEFLLDRALVKSVVWAESRFDCNATSDKGAKGLMQLMPSTFEECAAALRIPDARNKIYDPKISLRCGCYYLSVLIGKFDGDVTAALMAYNAGESNAKKFLRGDADVFPETEKYLKNIRTANRVYGFFGG